MAKGNAKKKDETKREKFARLGQYRVRKLLKNMDSIAKLSNPGSYDFTQDDISAMNEVVRNKWENVLNAFQGKAEEKEGFTF